MKKWKHLGRRDRSRVGRCCSPDARRAETTRPGRRRTDHREARRRDRDREQQPVDRRLVGPQARLRERRSSSRSRSSTSSTASQDIVPWLASEVAWADDYKREADRPRRREVERRRGLHRGGHRLHVEPHEGQRGDRTAANIPFDEITVDGDTVDVTFASSVFVKQDKVLQKLHRPRAHLGRRRRHHAPRPTPSPSAPVPTRSRASARRA